MKPVWRNRHLFVLEEQNFGPTRFSIFESTLPGPAPVMIDACLSFYWPGVNVRY